jgi:exopolyphosphatase/guanosine-5'-triphosphate,3'-diphosphate pyrophosphatase
MRMRIAEEWMASGARWEWRTFGAGAEAGAPAFEGRVSSGTADSEERYLLSAGGTTVKIRGGLMDVKALLAVDANGLQQWRPVLKVGFPIDAEAIRAVWEALRLPTPALARDAYTAEQLEAELTGPGTGVRAVAVHKHRVRYVIDGCTSELTDVVADGRTTRTIAVETEDPALVTAAVRTLGLADYRNTAYPPGLAALLDGISPRYAVIDAGTNSIKFHVAERDGSGFRTLVDRAELTRLGEGLEEGGVVSADALARTRDAIAGMVREADGLHAVAIVAVGTAGLRIAANREDVVQAVAEATGVRIQVISGEDEARLAYLAVLAGLGLPDASLAVFDTGGGSTQLTIGHGTDVSERFSVDVGAVRFTERFGLDGAVSAAVLADAMAAIRADLSRLDGRDPVDRLVGMGGAVTNIAAVKHRMTTYDPDVIQGSVLERSELGRQLELYRTQTADERRSIPGLQPKRAEVILAGACIVASVMDALGADQLTVSDRGLRHGVLATRFGVTRAALEEST